MAIAVKPRTLPQAGTDTVEITIHETYEVEGIGRDTIELKGRLVANRTVPLLGRGAAQIDWETSTVVAQFTDLNLRGKSQVFGEVRVSLDRTVPSFAMVGGGHCLAAIPVQVDMPDHGLSLRTSEPVQLQSTVQTVPPIGDEKTESVRPVDLIDTRSSRAIGSMVHARVVWRELVDQQPAPVIASVRSAGLAPGRDDEISRLKQLLADALIENATLKGNKS